ncbi:MAG: hypothetical protein IPJ09_05675 [Saprospiraceae bacterium]|nr:hypothetical protein [Saprospiraceae bacterium]
MKTSFLLLLLLASTWIRCTKIPLQPTIIGDWQDQEDGYMMQIKDDGILILEGTQNLWHINPQSTELTISWPHEESQFTYQIITLNDEKLQIKLVSHNTDYPLSTSPQNFRRLPRTGYMGR